MTILVSFSLVYFTCMKNRTTSRALTGGDHQSYDGVEWSQVDEGRQRL